MSPGVDTIPALTMRLRGAANCFPRKSGFQAGRETPVGLTDGLMGLELDAATTSADEATRVLLICFVAAA